MQNASTAVCTFDVGLKEDIYWVVCVLLSARMALRTLLWICLYVWYVRAQEQYCKVASSGPCISGLCPSTSDRCIKTSTGEVCCDSTQIGTRDVTTTTSGKFPSPRVYLSTPYPVESAPSPRPLMDQYSSSSLTGNCVDKVHPTTGVSDCPRLAHLCNNTKYFNLMTQQCPKTCNRCTGSTSTTGCQDLVSPTTGVSNCAAVASYCKNPLYLNLMRQQCRKTCGYCT